MRANDDDSSSFRPLAYVFWHWPRPEVSLDTYEKKLTAFLSSLLVKKTPEIIDALSFRIEKNAPWGPQGRAIYEDWYVVRDFSDLGGLNDVAIKGETGAAHDSIKEYYLKGTGGIFKSVQGELELHRAGYTAWIEKPRDLSYPSYYEKISKITEGSRSKLWRRQMVLGPTPQFCLHLEEPISLPDDLNPIILKLVPIES